MNGKNDKNIVTAYIGLGSNMGDRKENLDAAVTMLRAADGVEVSVLSAYIVTAPVGYTRQPDFLNAAAEIKTTLSPHELLALCLNIEKELKRERILRWGPRTIDLDVLLYGNFVVNDSDLILPHPRMHEREFVMGPLNEIAPHAYHPVLKQTAGEIYEYLTKT